MHKISLLITYSILVLLSISCAPESNVYKQEAAAFCEVYNPDSWRDFSQNASYSEFQSELTSRISKVVVSPEFKSVFKELSETPYSPDLDIYSFYKERISKLTGTEWDCPNLEKFYSGQWERVTTKSNVTSPRIIDSIQHEGSELVLSISNNGDIYLNSAKLKNSDIDTLKEALALASLSEPPSIVLLTEPNVEQHSVMNVMENLSKLGVKNLRIGTVQNAPTNSK